MSERQKQIDVFLNNAGWAGATRRPLAGDASFRRYERVERGGEIAVLMDAPPPEEDVRPFVNITRHLLSLGYSAPSLMAEDIDAGFLLLEDLGDATFTNALAAGVDETQLYQAAVDVLVDLHGRDVSQSIPDHIEPYDEEKLLAEASLLTDWYLPGVSGGDVSDETIESYLAVWRDLVRDIAGARETLVLRDFHADNLMWLPERDGVAKCGLLDYQDALVGSRAYDLMSLLEDARRDIDPHLSVQLMNSYLQAFPDIDKPAFKAAFIVLAAQRHCKVIGIFTRLAMRDGKVDYLAHIPRVWRLLERACRAPELATLKDWLDTNIAENLRA
ncbi:MAG: phosphotransferase [Rhodospirillaceae bacterium]|jgi:N-acetylmuramate 1-kinase|nr:phosphotransferase [Rhodospirillaceae bacterium]MBT4588146.1 phosphotransferase [Rhodospirillaceae bacterium]MBT4939891.1 phosphotransferase [Rhodospirillaceae bacterium]MBT7266780.1 phosphotransferase [Rhodospirillaceae bacterium]